MRPDEVKRFAANRRFAEAVKRSDNLRLPVNPEKLLVSVPAALRYLRSTEQQRAKK